MKASRKPKISVIMSVYNGMPYLKESIKSILNQTYKDFEFIIVNDASIDGSWQYLKKIADKRIILLKNKKNLGLAASLNKALKKSSGDYIARMDADDISLPNRFKTQVNYLLKHPKIDLCGTWVYLIDDQGKIVGEKKYPTNPDQVKKAITWYPAVIHPTYMGKNTFFKKLEGYRLNFDFAEDYDLLARAKNKFKIANVPEKLLRWRLWNQRRSRNSMIKMDRVDLMIKMETFKSERSINSALALMRKIILTYTLPLPLKMKVATLLKQA